MMMMMKRARRIKSVKYAALVPDQQQDVSVAVKQGVLGRRSVFHIVTWTDGVNDTACCKLVTLCYLGLTCTTTCTDTHIHTLTDIL